MAVVGYVHEQPAAKVCDYRNNKHLGSNKNVGARLLWAARPHVCESDQHVLHSVQDHVKGQQSLAALFGTPALPLTRTARACSPDLVSREHGTG